MKKLLPKLLLGATGVWVGSMLIYWFNLDLFPGAPAAG